MRPQPLLVTSIRSDPLLCPFPTFSPDPHCHSTLDIYSSSSGIPALISHAADDILRGSGHLSDVLQDPKTSHSYAPADAASPRAWQGEGGGEPVPTWEYFGRPGNEARLMRFGAAMRGVGSVFQGWENGPSFLCSSLPLPYVNVLIGDSTHRLPLRGTAGRRRCGRRRCRCRSFRRRDSQARP